jgi:uncharacterized protein (TIGR00661 family)
MISKGKSVRVLFAPLDWGLGHATRCIPLIGEFLLNDCDVVLAADGASAQLLAREFPQLEIKKLQGYNVQYGHRFLFFNILLQLPHIFLTIKREKEWLNSILQQEHFDIIVSDNRPGFWTKKSFCVYISHQLSIKGGMGRWPDHLLQRLHHYYIKKFNRVWVPDLSDSTNLAGELSHPKNPFLKPEFIGLISRLKQTENKNEIFDLLILLSGPEPQRSILEEIILKQLPAFKQKVVLVRGVPGAKVLPIETDNLLVYNHLTASHLEEIMQQSKLVLCRSGYSTLMDLLKLKKKAVLIPTPGQPEQEYLAEYVQSRSYFPFINQKKLNLNNILAITSSFSYQHSFKEEDFERYREVIDNLLSSVKEE